MSLQDRFFTDQADLFTRMWNLFSELFDTKATPVGASQTDPTQGRAHGVWPIHFKRTTIGRCRHIYPKQGHSSQAHKTDRPVVLAGSGYRKSAEAGQSHAREHENTFKSWVCQKSFGDQRHHHNQPKVGKDNVSHKAEKLSCRSYPIDHEFALPSRTVKKTLLSLNSFLKTLFALFHLVAS